MNVREVTRLCPVPAHGWGQDAVDVLLDGIVFPHTLFQASVFGVQPTQEVVKVFGNGNEPVADAANLRIAFAVGNVLLMLCKIHSTENDVIMAMLLVDVGSDDILIYLHNSCVHTNARNTPMTGTSFLRVIQIFLESVLFSLLPQKVHGTDDPCKSD